MNSAMGHILTVAEAARVLGVAPVVVEMMIGKGELVALVRVASDALIAESALREFISGAWTGEPPEGWR